jgi:hypothetical protein
MLVYIFIFAGIFVALSYAVSESFKFNEGSARVVSEEKMRLVFTEMKNVVEANRIAVHTMLAKGVPKGHLSGYYFEGGDYYYTANGDCVVNTCRIYLPEGGGVSWYKFTKMHPNLTDIPDEIGQFYFPNGIYVAPVADIGTTEWDLVYSFRITRDFCNFINRQLGISVDIDTTTTVSIGNTIRLNTNWHTLAPTNHSSAFTSTMQGGHLRGRREGCYRTVSNMPAGGTGMTYRYFALIKAF